MLAFRFLLGTLLSSLCPGIALQEEIAVFDSAVYYPPI